MDRDNLSNIYTQQWNVSLQRELPGSWLVEAGYAGNKGTRLPVALQFNQLDPRFQSLGNALNTQVPNPFFGLVQTGNALHSHGCAEPTATPLSAVCRVEHGESRNRAKRSVVDLSFTAAQGRETLSQRNEPARVLHHFKAHR